MRAAAAEAAAEVDEYRAMRASRLNSSTPEAAATLERLCVLSRCCCNARVRFFGLQRAGRAARPPPHFAARPLSPPARRRRVTADTDAGLAALDAEFMRNKDLVIGMLLQMVLSIENPFSAK